MPETQSSQQHDQPGEQATESPAAPNRPPDEQCRCDNHQPSAPRKQNTPARAAKFADVQRPSIKRLVETRRPPAINEKSEQQDSREKRERFPTTPPSTRREPPHKNRSQQNRRLEKRDPQGEPPRRCRDIGPRHPPFFPNPRFRRERDGDQQHKKRLVIRSPELKPVREDRRDRRHQPRNPPIRQTRRESPGHQKPDRREPEKRRHPRTGEFEVSGCEWRDRRRNPRDQRIQRHCRVRRGSLGEILPGMMPDRPQTILLDHPNACHPRIAVPVGEKHLSPEKNRLFVPSERRQSDPPDHRHQNHVPEKADDPARHGGVIQHLVEARRSHPNILCVGEKNVVPHRPAP